MKKTTQIFALILLICSYSFMGCKNESAKDGIIGTPKETREPNDDELRDYGIISGIEDNGYPFYSITVSFPERNVKGSYNLNIEAIHQDIEALNALKDKDVTLYYKSEADNMVMDVHFNERSIHFESTPEIDASWKKVTGILKEAIAESGDTPNTFSVTTKEGRVAYFTDFITERMALRNGKEVTVYYRPRYVNKITYLKA
ncbi:hypothetical protein [Pontimicrobium sp. MEBiC01747]